MQKRAIQTALTQIEDYYGGDPQKLILVVPFKKGKAPFERSEVIERIADDRQESVSDVQAMLKGYVPAAYVKAADVIGDYYLIEGDACLLRDEGKYADTHHGMEVITMHPDDLNLAGAWIVDENMECHKDLSKAVREIGDAKSRRRRYY